MAAGVYHRIAGTCSGSGLVRGPLLPSSELPPTAGINEDTSHNYSALGMTTCIPKVWVPRASLLFGYVLAQSDQALDGGVAVSMFEHKDYTYSALLVASVIVPQTIIWFFLWSYQMTNIISLIRILFLPACSLVAFSVLQRLQAPHVACKAALFMCCFSLETVYHVTGSWASGKEAKALIWSTIAESLLEAPTGLFFTLYPVLLKFSLRLSIDSHEKLHMKSLFGASIICSFVSIAKGAMKLDAYGQNSTMFQNAIQLLFEKTPRVVSQMLTFVFFAVCVRTHGNIDSEDDLKTEMHTSHQMLFGIFFLFQLLINYSLLKVAVRRLNSSVAVLFSFTILLAGPPSFLHSMNRTRVTFSIVQFAFQILLAATALQSSPPGSPQFAALTGLPFLIALYIICVPTALMATCMSSWCRSTSGDDTILKRALTANSGLCNAVRDRDFIMINLMIDIEGADPLTAQDDLDMHVLQIVAATWNDDARIWNALTRSDSEPLREEARKQRELLLKEISDGNAAILKRAAGGLCSNRKLVLEAVSINGVALEFAAEELRGDCEIVRVAFFQNSEAMKFATKELQAAAALCDVEDSLLHELETLDRKRWSEIRAYAVPPEMVRKTLCAVMTVMEKDEEEEAATWGVARRELQDPAVFVQQIKAIHKERIKDSTLRKLEKFINHKNFKPNLVKNVSYVGGLLCQWVHWVVRHAEACRESGRVDTLASAWRESGQQCGTDGKEHDSSYFKWWKAAIHSCKVDLLRRQQPVGTSLRPSARTLELVRTSTSVVSEASMQAAMCALEEASIFEWRPLGASPFPRHGTFTEAFLSALAEVARCVPVAAPQWEEDLAQAVSWRLANSDTSIYEVPNASTSIAWPTYAAACPNLEAKLHLARSGVATYFLGPNVKVSCCNVRGSGAVLCDGSGSWALFGEGCWRVLPAVGQPSEVIVEMRHGLEGRGSPSNFRSDSGTSVSACREPPCVLRVNLQDCFCLQEEDDEEEQEE